MTVHPLQLNSPRSFNLGFLSPHNPYDRRTFSGTAFFAARALAERPDIDLTLLGPHRPLKVLDKVLRRRRPTVDADQIDVSGLDAVVGLVATPLLDRLMTRHPNLPVLHVTDATPAFLRDAYGWKVPDNADAMETSVAVRASKVIFSSDALANRAPHDLQLPGLMSETIPFGVNLEQLPDICPQKPPLTKLHLLFIGLDWERKGGDIAVAALEHLRTEGRAAHLTIVGRCPERFRNHPDITYAGYLNKNRPKHAEQLIQLYRNAHLLLVPSRADCTPMVLAEAMAHGTPALATDTGGISTVIGAGGTGQLLPLYTSPRDWARAITELVSRQELYDFMSDACFDRAQNVLSWPQWAAQIEHVARRAASEMQPTALRDLKAASGI